MAAERHRISGRQAGGRDLLGTVREVVMRHSMFEPGQSVLAAVSGGPDSVAMLDLLVRLSTEMSLRLGVAYFDHGLRGQASSSDGRFVESLCADYRLPFHTGTADTKAHAAGRRMSLEEAGRNLRYRFLIRAAVQNGYERVAVGHHRDDNAESVLMALLRGSGPSGLSGISAVRADGVVRPLIALSRGSIMEYIRARNLAFVSDQTNFDTRLVRNRIRLELLPRLTADYNPNIAAALARTAELLQQEERWLEEMSRKMLEDVLAGRADGYAALSLSRFNRLHPAARRRVFRLALTGVRGHLRRIGLVHVTDALEMASGASTGARLHLPGGTRIRRTDRSLEIIAPGRFGAGEDRPEGAEFAPSYSYVMAAPGVLTISETGDSVRIVPVAVEAAPGLKDRPPGVEYIDADRVRFPLTVRNIRPGDRFSPLGVDGTQKLKKFFCDHKIPRRRRRSCPLLISGDRIVWVAGMRIDNAVKLTRSTRRVLKAELIRSNQTGGPATVRRRDCNHDD